MKKLSLIALVSGIIVILGCGGGGGVPGGVANGLPIISTLTPGTIKAGAPDTVVLVTGANYQSGVIVKIDGAARTTEEINIRQIKVHLTAADLATAGTFKITATNPDGYISPAKDFVVSP